MPEPTSFVLDLASLRWPAEWEAHAATWLAWPHNEEDWPGRYGPIPWVFGEVIRHLSRAERVRLLVNEANEAEARALLSRIGVNEDRVFLRQAVTDRVWTRDYLPTFVQGANDRLVGVKWRFNGWAKYDDWRNDDRAGRMICENVQTPNWEPFDASGPTAVETPTWRGQPVVMEGGAIDGNGAGTLMATEECLLSAEVQCRNPGLTKSDYEALFTRYLGSRKVVWLRHGLAGDDTHGHIDDLARFVNRTTVVAAVEEDRGDANFDPLQENFELLRSATTADSDSLTVVPLPMPAPLSCDGQRLPASYANFYIANGLVLVPTFNDANDRRALNTLAELFPNRQVIGIYCGDLVGGLGTLHCLTQQVPS
jgi:agmatine deiminase